MSVTQARSEIISSASTVSAARTDLDRLAATSHELQNRCLRVGEIVAATYEITAVLGAGGMGIIYEARDVRLNRVVALKVARHVGDAQLLRKEAQGLAAVRHPNLVGVHALGEHDGIDFIVMERIHGKTLEALLDEAKRARRRLPIAEIIDWLIAVTDGLTAVHGAGIAHRDVKLGNVMVAGDRVVLMDFGLDRLHGPRVDQGPRRAGTRTARRPLCVGHSRVLFALRRAAVCR